MKQNRRAEIEQRARKYVKEVFSDLLDQNISNEAFEQAVKKSARAIPTPISKNQKAAA